MNLSSLTRRDLIFPNLSATDTDSVLGELAAGLTASGVVSEPDSLKERLIERERLGSTGIGNGIAIPHCKMPGLDRVVLAIGRSAAGVEFSALDHGKVHIFFLLLSPAGASGEHLQALAKVSKLLKRTEAQSLIAGENDPQAILDVLEREERKVV